MGESLRRNNDWNKDYSEGYRPSTLPRAFRLIQGSDQLLNVRTERGDNHLEVNIIEKGPIKIVGLAINTLLQSVGEKAPGMVARFSERRHEINNGIHPALEYVISIDPPNFNEETDEYRLMKGIEADNLDHIPDDMEYLELPPTTFACMTKAENDHSVFGSLWRWIHNSEFELADLYSIELFDLTQGTDSCTLMFPVRKKSRE